MLQNGEHFIVWMTIVQDAAKKAISDDDVTATILSTFQLKEKGDH